MNCGELQSRLDAYARGTLPPAEAAAFEAHLTNCSACAALLETREPALAPTGTLQRSVEPDADLWPGIQARLAPRGGRGSNRIAVPRWLLAAAAVLLIAVSSGVTALLLQRSQRAATPLATSSVSPLEVQYASAAADLSAELERARSRLAPATVRTIERNLAVIDSALAEARRALAGDPGNAALEQLVIAAWRQKMDFLRRATALSGAS
jgi:anti-sigma-K factor RskA